MPSAQKRLGEITALMEADNFWNNREQAQKLVGALSAIDYRVASREPRPGAGLEFENQVLLAHPGKAEYGCMALHWSLLDFPSYQRRLRMEVLS